MTMRTGQDCLVDGAIKRGDFVAEGVVLALSGKSGDVGGEVDDHGEGDEVEGDLDLHVEAKLVGIANGEVGHDGCHIQVYIAANHLDEEGKGGGQEEGDGELGAKPGQDNLAA